MWEDFLIRWLITSVAIFAVPALIRGVRVENFGAALAAGLVLGVLNALVKPVVFFLTLPLTVLTLGLFALVLNGAFFSLAAGFVRGVRVQSFGAAIGASLVVSAVSWLANSL